MNFLGLTLHLGFVCCSQPFRSDGMRCCRRVLTLLFCVFNPFVFLLAFYFKKLFCLVWALVARVYCCLFFISIILLLFWSFWLFGLWLVPLRQYSSSKFPSSTPPTPFLANRVVLFVCLFVCLFHIITFHLPPPPSLSLLLSLSLSVERNVDGETVLTVPNAISLTAPVPLVSGDLSLRITKPFEATFQYPPPLAGAINYLKKICKNNIKCVIFFQF